MKNLKIYACKMEPAVCSKRYEELVQYVQTEKAQKLKTYVNNADRYRSLLGEILFRDAAIKEFGLTNKEITIIKGKYGKPYVKAIPELQFNISHAEDWVVCAIHHQAVGIDIEKRQKADLGIAKRFFTKDEYKMLMDLPLIEQDDAFIRLWTLKESYLKHLGVGLVYPMDRFCFQLSSDVAAVVGEENGPLLKTYLLDGNYIVSVCAQTNQVPLKIKEIALSDLF